MLAYAPTYGGIYRILNTVNGKCYVGSAVNIQRRWRLHLKSFAGAVRGNRYLYRAWHKYGAHSFRFEVLERVDAVSELTTREQYWIERLNACVDGYNIRLIAASNLGLNLPVSDETKRKIGRANKGRRFSSDTPHWLRGKRHAQSSCQKMSQSKRSRDVGRIVYDGKSMCLSDWADSLQITVRALGNRLRRGWPLERALTEPSRGY